MFKPEIFSLVGGLHYSRPAMMLDMINDISIEFQSMLPLKTNKPRNPPFVNIMAEKYFMAAIASNYSSGYSICAENGINAFNAYLNYAETILTYTGPSNFGGSSLAFMTEVMVYDSSGQSATINKLITDANTLSKININAFDISGAFRKKWKAAFRVSRADLNGFTSLDTYTVPPQVLGNIASNVKSDKFVDIIYNHIKQVFTSAFDGGKPNLPYELTVINIFALSAMLFHTAIISNNVIADWMSVVAERNMLILLKEFSGEVPSYKMHINKGVNRRLALASEYLFTYSCGRLFNVFQSPKMVNLLPKMYTLATRPISAQEYTTALRQLLAPFISGIIQLPLYVPRNGELCPIIATTDVYYTDHLQAIGRWVATGMGPYTSRPLPIKKVTNPQDSKLYLTLSKDELIEFLRFPNKVTRFHLHNAALKRDGVVYPMLPPPPPPTMPVYVSPPPPTMPVYVSPPPPTMPVYVPPSLQVATGGGGGIGYVLPPPQVAAEVAATGVEVAMPVYVPPSPQVAMPVYSDPNQSTNYTNVNSNQSIDYGATGSNQTLYTPAPTPATRPMDIPPETRPATASVAYVNQDKIPATAQVATTQVGASIPDIPYVPTLPPGYKFTWIIKFENSPHLPQFIRDIYSLPKLPRGYVFSVVVKDNGVASYNNINANASSAPMTTGGPWYMMLGPNAQGNEYIAEIEVATTTSESFATKYRNNAKRAASSYQTFETRQRSGFTDLDLRRVLY